MPHHRKSWIAESTLTAGYLVVALLLGLLSSEPPHVTPLWSMLLLTVGGVMLIAIHRRFSRIMFVGAMLLSVLSFICGTGAEFFLVLISLYRAGAHRSARAAWASLVITLAFSMLGALILAYRLTVGPSLWGTNIPMSGRDSALDWLNSVTILVVLALIVTLLGVNVGHRRRYVGALVNRAEQMERERDQQAEIAGALERERIAREMHDVIAHSLSVMIAMADGAHASAIERPAEAQRAIGRVAETGRRTLDEVRRLLGTVRGEEEVLHTGYIPQPDSTQIPTLIAEFREAGLPVREKHTGVPSEDRVLGLTVYRIVQESLTNVLRHGRSTQNVLVTTAWTHTEVTIVVEDESAPTSLSEHPGRGIVGIRERAALYDGTVEAGPREGGGWHVSVRLSFEREQH